MVFCMALAACATDQMDKEDNLPRPAPPAPALAAELKREVSAMGYGNWIVIAESSFPVYSRRGVRTLLVDAEIPAVLDQVLTSLEYSDSVKPKFTTSTELAYLHNDRAPGIDQFRTELETALHGFPTRRMDYRALSLLLEDSSNKFAVLVLKTNTSLPYTSIFIELQSNYWDRENETELREKLKAAEPLSPEKKLPNPLDHP